MTELQIQSTIDYMADLWPDWNSTGAILQQFKEMFKYADEDKTLAVLKKARFRNDFKTPPFKYISDEIEKIKKKKPLNIIMVYALREEDGKSVTVACKANNPEQAREVMRKYMFHWYDREHDCNPDEFTFYIGEANYYAFTAARRQAKTRRIA